MANRYTDNQAGVLWIGQRKAVHQLTNASWAQSLYMFAHSILIYCNHKTHFASYD